MWQYIEERFAGKQAKLRVVSTMLRLGLRVDPSGRIFCDNIEIAPAKFARAIDVDRRVVIEAAGDIAADKQLLGVFSHLLPTANVAGAARQLGHEVVDIDADPNSVGLTAKVTAIMARHKVKIRQIIADDPDLYPEPKLHLVLEGRLPRAAAEELRNLRVQAVSFK